MTKEHATALFEDITCKFPNITFTNLDAYLKTEAKLRCINIFKEDFKADTTFVIKNFKIKSD